MRANVGRGAECCAEESYSLRSGSVPVAEDAAIQFLQSIGRHCRPPDIGLSYFHMETLGRPLTLDILVYFLSDINWGHDISVIRHPEVKEWPKCCLMYKYKAVWAN